MTDVFISYKREERARCVRIAEKLRGLGLDVWFDAKLESGMSFDAEIEEKVNAAKAVLVLWSPASVKSNWVRNEATIGAQRDALVSVELAPCTRPVQFTNTHTEPLHDANFADTDAGWAAVLRRLGKLTGKMHLTLLADALSGAASGARADKGGKSGGLGAGLAGLALGLIAGGAAGFFLANTGDRSGVAESTAAAPAIEAPRASAADLVGRWGGGAFACGKLEITLGLAPGGLSVGVGTQQATLEPISDPQADGWFRSENNAAPNFWKLEGGALLWRVGDAGDANSETRLSPCLNTPVPPL